jgi:peptide/nickel transport system substrate-binding protein
VTIASIVRGDRPPVRRRLLAAALVLLLALGLAACTKARSGGSKNSGPIAGTKIVLGWTAGFTSANAAQAPTVGNLDIAAATRGRFGDVVDGRFTPDPGFGTVKVVSEAPFTVRYDLAQPSWSDGIPLDAADLLLGWAGETGRLDPAPGAPAQDDADPVPRIDEFARAIDVTFPHPRIDWQTAVGAPVPAHVVGRLAFGLDDPMEAKQAVITAIRTGDRKALAAIADVWKSGFDLPEKGAIPSRLLLSSGPYKVDRVERGQGGQHVRLIANPGYAGAPKPKVARIDLVPPAQQPEVGAGDGLDIVQVSPTAENRAPIHALELKDFTVTTTNDGTLWAMVLNPVGVFSSAPARTAFFHAAPANAMIQGGGGEWASAYAATTSMVTSPDSPAYKVVDEGSGFTAALGTPGDDPGLERRSVGVADGARVCVLYDRGSEFARGAFAALQTTARKAGWEPADCGTDDVAAALPQRAWEAAIVRVPLPQTTDQIAALWASAGSAALTPSADPSRDQLIAQLAKTTDEYQARDLRAQIEASIVRAAVVLPIATNPRITVIDRGIGGVSVRNGAAASLLAGAAAWTAAP